MSEQQPDESGKAKPDRAKPDNASPSPTVPEPTAPPTPPAPPREVKIAPDERLNLAYNPHYSHTGEVREAVLLELVRRTQRGARAHCSRCERISVRFVPFKTPIGQYVVAVCEQCGAWYLM